MGRGPSRDHLRTTKIVILPSIHPQFDAESSPLDDNERPFYVLMANSGTGLTVLGECIPASERINLFIGQEMFHFLVQALQEVHAGISFFFFFSVFVKLQPHVDWQYLDSFL